MARTRLKGCEDFHRTVATERHPAVGVTRRGFLQVGVGAGLALYTARALPLQAWMEGAAEAAAQGADDTILVSVFLPGGLDLLDTLVPLGDYGGYRANRGLNAQPNTVPKLGSTGFGVHPSITHGDGGGLKGLFDRGQLGFLPGIDYANPDLSHFQSRAFWETGIITATATTGWLGRWLDRHGRADNPFQGLSAGFRLSPTLLTAGAPVCSVEAVDRAELSVNGLNDQQRDAALIAYRDLAYARSGDGRGRKAVRASARFAQGVADQLRPLAAGAPQNTAAQGDAYTLPLLGTPPKGYPTGSPFADRMRQLAFMLGQPLGTRIATVDAASDFDTHDGQGPRLADALSDVSSTLSAFQSDLAARGLADRVLTFVWSEFGRRPRGNNSGGTDHGAGGLGWVLGTRANGGVLTDYPALGALDDKGNLAVTVDFRQVYASLIEQWLGTPADGVIPDAAGLARVQVVR